MLILTPLLDFLKEKTNRIDFISYNLFNRISHAVFIIEVLFWLITYAYILIKYCPFTICYK